MQMCSELIRLAQRFRKPDGWGGIPASACYIGSVVFKL